MAKRQRTVGGPIIRPAHDAALIGRDHEMKIIRREEKLVGYTAAPAPDEASRQVPDDDAGAIATLIRLIERDLRRWADILNRSHMPGEYMILKRSGQAAKWLETAVEKCVDYEPFKMERGADGIMRKVYDRPKIRPLPPTAAELSWMDAMAEVLLTLKPSTLAWRLVTGRAHRVSWANLQQYDLDRRRIRQLQNLHRAALVQLLAPWLIKIHKM